MNLAEALLPLLARGRGVIVLVGAGGKTSALFRLGEALAGPVLLTSTTHLLDPLQEPGRPALERILRADLEGPAGSAALPEPRPGLTLLMSRAAEIPEKLKGIHPSWIPGLAAQWRYVLVEADGSRGLPVKAPGPREPVLPPEPDLLLGVIGLACLGRPMDAASVHRPEAFAAVTGCRPGQPIGWEHLAALAGHPQGLFKGHAGTRVLLLNQADAVQGSPWEGRLAELPVAQVLLASLGRSEGVIVLQRGTLR
jgi:probable selenium-dependent hydroxylase accessory protein YqeC